MRNLLHIYIFLFFYDKKFKRVRLPDSPESESDLKN